MPDPELLDVLQPGDTLVADCYHCTYWLIAAVFESHRIGGPVSLPLKTRVNPLTLL